MRFISSFALASAAAVAARAENVEVEQLLSSALAALSPAVKVDEPEPSVNPICVARYCGNEGKDCFMNSECRSALKCVAGCGKTINQTCIFQCNSDFENDSYDNLMHCMFNAHDCMGTKKDYDIYNKCRPMDKVGPMKTYKGEPLTKDLARKLVMRGTMRGDWMVAKGKSAAYDCFPCQFGYWVGHPDGTMNYIADFKVHRSNGNIRWNKAYYDGFEWYEGIGRYSMNASSDGGLAHYEDWRFLAADEESEQPQWLAFYYCGSVPGVGEAYEGAWLLTPDGNLPTGNGVMDKITAMFGGHGLVLECKTNNDDCSGHPAPPTSLAAALVV